MFTIENFKKGLQKISKKMIVEENADKILLFYTPVGYNSRDCVKKLIAEFDISNLESIIDNIKNNEFNETELYNEQYFETAIQLNSMFYGPWWYRIEKYNIEEHAFNIGISIASNAYLFALLCSSIDDEINLMLSNGPSHILFREDAIMDLEDLSSRLKIYTIKISSPTSNKIEIYRKMVNSYIFNISYNYNTTFSIRDFSQTTLRNRYSIRRDGQLFPYHNYNNELTKYYYQGTSIDIPFAQYLSFYHVPEFFIQSMAEQNAFQEIENFIVKPSFSPHNKEHIRKFYNQIKKTMRSQRDDGVWEEKSGLLLCLKKFVPNLENLKDTIISLDKNAIEYYEKNTVEFADNSDTINFCNNEDDVYLSIRNRIYAVRNAIVHSKDGERLRYEPFKHDKKLIKEIPLIRGIAEEIIINSSKAINISFE